MTQLRKVKLKHISKTLSILLLGLVVILLLAANIGTVAEATGLVDNTVDSAHEYSRYPLDHYQLDFYVDNSWNWLPWNWTDGIGQQVMYGLYAITSFIWTINLYVSYATGYLIQEAYSLDFISDTTNAIGENIQTLAGITRNGFAREGFYIGFLLLLILVVGMYVTYIGLIKRETTKAIHAVTNFVVLFLFSSAFIAYAPDTIGRINEFSSDVSEASLSLGTRIILPHSDTEGSDSVDLIRDSLFSIQVKQPWLLLQYGTNNEEDIGEERIEELLSTSPYENSGENREQIVREEIEERNNPHMTITQTTSRLGVGFFISTFNIGISIFVFLLTGIMIFSQVLFIIYAMFLPISFLLSMLPSFEYLSKRALTKLFNTILARAGITLILTVAFSISTMLYSLSVGYPFFLIAFLQIVTFAGIYFKLGDLMGLFALQSNESQGISRQVMRKPRLLMHANMHRLQRKVGRSLTLLGAGAVAAKATKDSRDEQEASSDSKLSRSTPNTHQRDSEKPRSSKQEQEPSKQQKSTYKKTRKPVTTIKKNRERLVKKQEADYSYSEKRTPKYSSKNSRQNQNNLSSVPTGKKNQWKEQANQRKTVARSPVKIEKSSLKKRPSSYARQKDRNSFTNHRSAVLREEMRVPSRHSIPFRLRDQKEQKKLMIKRETSSRNQSHYRKTPVSINKRTPSPKPKMSSSTHVHHRRKDGKR